MTEQRAEEIARDDVRLLTLNTFVWREGGRAYIAEPFSKGDWTYASNGTSAIRIPRIPGMDGHPHAPDAERLFSGAFVPDLTFTPAPAIAEMPAEGWIDCEYCEGRGVEHECSSCDCPCDWCDGKGRESDFVGAGSPFRGIYLGLHTIKLVWLLPCLKVVDQPKKGEAIPFIFDGGQGLMMPIKGEPQKRTIDVFALKTAAPWPTF